MKYFKYLLINLLWITLNFMVNAQDTASNKTNVIIIFADDMGFEDVSCLNPEARTYTPHIDKLAQKAMVFTNAHSSASVCTPSRYGLLTGRYAWQSKEAAGVCNGFTPVVIEQGRRTIANIFKDAGYTTACIGKWHLGIGWQTEEGASRAIYDNESGFSNVNYSKPLKEGPNDFGFDYSYILPASLDMPPYVFLRNHQADDPNMVLTSDLYPRKLKDTEYAWDKKHTDANDIYWHKGVWWREGEVSASFQVENCLNSIQEEGISFIKRHVSAIPDEPFFLYLPLTAPHTPWLPSEQFKGKSAVGTYGDFVLNVDNVVGEIMVTLGNLGIDENTIIIFSSDNGAYWPESEIALHNHDSNWGTRGQKGDIWDGGHRIPLIISWPGMIQSRSMNDQLVSLTDLYATFSAMNKQSRSDNGGEDSYNMLPALRGDTDYIIRPSMIHHSSGGMYGFRKGNWKIIEGRGSGGFTAPSGIEPEDPAYQLYRILTDSLELENVSQKYPEVSQDLLRELHQQIDQR